MQDADDALILLQEWLSVIADGGEDPAESQQAERRIARAELPSAEAVGTTPSDARAFQKSLRTRQTELRWAEDAWQAANHREVREEAREAAQSARNRGAKWVRHHPWEYEALDEAEANLVEEFANGKSRRRENLQVASDLRAIAHLMARCTYGIAPASVHPPKQGRPREADERAPSRDALIAAMLAMADTLENPPRNAAKAARDAAYRALRDEVRRVRVMVGRRGESAGGSASGTGKRPSWLPAAPSSRPAPDVRSSGFIATGKKREA
jgi:hypothetical protein